MNAEECMNKFVASSNNNNKVYFMKRVHIAYFISCIKIQ